MSGFPSDLEIAQGNVPLPIASVAASMGIPDAVLIPYGRFKAKLDPVYLRSLHSRPAGKLVLVTAISPTPAGEGKTTTTVGLGDALRRLGHRAVLALREPSMGPVFGMKGGAAGGGRAQVVPMEDINLHFTGDFAAVTAAHNLLAALVDNHLHHGNALDLDPARITWRRALDINDRALREIEVGLGAGNGVPRHTGFDIAAASEVMAVLCLSRTLDDLKARLGRIVIGRTRGGAEVTAADLHAHGAMAVLLKDAFAPNLVQTLEHTPAFVHGGPFANIAHGCNSVVATEAALRLGDYVVTEAGFGSDLGAEKFMDIKCRASGLRPQAAVLVATVRALKFHGGVAVADLSREDVPALLRGMDNLRKHLVNLRSVFELPVVVAVNRFPADTEAELAAVIDAVAAEGEQAVVASHWSEGGAGAVDLARAVVAACEQPSAPAFAYPAEAPLLQKLEAIAHRLYGAAGVELSEEAAAALEELTAAGHGHLPVCVAKTQYSFSVDPKLLGAPTGHVLAVRELRLSAGAGFVVAVCGSIMTMPGLSASPAAERIDLVDGQVRGLF